MVAQNAAMRRRQHDHDESGGGSLGAAGCSPDAGMGGDRLAAAAVRRRARLDAQATVLPPAGSSEQDAILNFPTTGPSRPELEKLCKSLKIHLSGDDLKMLAR